MGPILARNHELTGFATGAVTGSAMGAPASGALVLGLLGALAADFPDIDSPRARIVKMLTLVPYPVRNLDRNGEHKRGKYKPKKIRVRVRRRGKNKGAARKRARDAAKRKLRNKLFWLKTWAFLTEVITGPQEPRGPKLYIWRGFPGYQLHRLSVWASEAVYDRYATEADRRDLVPHQGCRFRSHRGLTHSLWAALGIGLLAWVLGVVLGATVGENFPDLTPMFGSSVSLSVLVGVTVSVGMITHVAGDGCTDMGVSFFAPLVRWQGRNYPVQALLFEPLRFKTGQQVEKDLISWLCAALAGVALLFSLGLLWPAVDAVGRVWAAL